MSSPLVSEEEWLSCDDPARLLDSVVGLPGQRKLRLFACACCQRVEALLTRSAVHDALRTAERFADGQAGPPDLRAGWAAVRQALSQSPVNTRWEHALMAVLHSTTEPMSVFAAQQAAESAARARDDDWRQRHPRPLGPEERNRSRYGSPEERLYQCHLVRDLFPTRPPSPDPAWARWQGGVVLTLAQVIYQEERFCDLPVLADALEEAGCIDEALLSHCRQSGTHARGCWALDCVLGGQV